MVAITSGYTMAYLAHQLRFCIFLETRIDQQKAMDQFNTADKWLDMSNQIVRI